MSENAWSGGDFVIGKRYVRNVEAGGFESAHSVEAGGDIETG